MEGLRAADIIPLFQIMHGNQRLLFTWCRALAARRPANKVTISVFSFYNMVTPGQLKIAHGYYKIKKSNGPKRQAKPGQYERINNHEHEKRRQKIR